MPTPAMVSGAALWQWWRSARQQAETAGVDRVELDWLLRAVADLDGLALRLESFRDRPVVCLTHSLAELEELWSRRICDRTPLQYLIGHTTWRDLAITVTPDVLIPRPETELMIDLVVEAIAQSSLGANLAQGIWVDLGTGSGILAMGLAQAMPQAQVYGVDVSAAALAIAAQNALHNGLTGQEPDSGIVPRVQWRQGSWFAPLADLAGQVAGMVSNPPYIPRSTIPSLQPEVAHHEPQLALDGGDDGLDSIRVLVATAPDYLQAGGLWLIEMMAGQAEAVTQLLVSHGAYEGIQIRSDLAGIPRFAIAHRR